MSKSIEQLKEEIEARLNSGVYKKKSIFDNEQDYKWDWRKRIWDAMVAAGQVDEEITGNLDELFQWEPS